jgi:two-component system cell cycle sensor histidine kinase/response regulator CckA
VTVAATRQAVVGRDSIDTVAQAGGVKEGSRVARPILLVDDDPSIRQLVGCVLRGEGYDVLEASDGSQAFEIAEREQQIELVVSDIVMPGMSGVQLCEKLKMLRPDLKLILMSGNDFGLLTQDNSAHFIAKPFVPKDLVEKVRTVLSAVKFD